MVHGEYSIQFGNDYFTEMCSGSEAGSYFRLIDFVYHSTLGLKVVEKKKTESAVSVLSLAHWAPNLCIFLGMQPCVG